MIIHVNNNGISKFHQSFLDYYESKYPTHRILVEVDLEMFIKKQERKTGLRFDSTIKKRVSNLRFDTYDETVNKVFEINGSQHFEFNSFFHKDLGAFDRQQNNDGLKEKVCAFFDVEIVNINNLGDIELC